MLEEMMWDSMPDDTFLEKTVNLLSLYDEVAEIHAADGGTHHL